MLRQLAASALLTLPWRGVSASEPAVPPAKVMRRVRPTDPAWPSAATWQKFSSDLGGRVIKVESPLVACATSQSRCEEVFHLLQNPYWIGDQPGATQTSGWLDAWTSKPSAYAVAAQSTADVVAAVDFARRHDLRLVVKGGGHSYHGASSAPDSLLIWTRAMNHVELHDAFVGNGDRSAANAAPQPAVSIGAGAMWTHAYDAVTTRARRYVQGGGCATVGVAGLVLGGGFSPFSKGYGTAAAGLLEAEIVTADGVVRIANADQHPDLFWAIKGGGAGSLGVVTRLTLKTYELPGSFGMVLNRITAASDDAFRRLIDAFMHFYRDRVFNPHWGNIVSFHPDNSLMIEMLFQGFDKAQAREVWRPFFEWVASSPQDFSLESRPLISRLLSALTSGLAGHGFSLEGGPIIFDMPAQYWWDAAVWQEFVPGFVIPDSRPGAAAQDVFYAANAQESGWFIHGYQSTWMPATLLGDARRADLVDALFAGSRHCAVALHFNKGLAGASDEALAASRDTATNPAVLDAFALAIVAGFEAPAFPGVAGHEPDLTAAHANAAAISRSMAALREVAPGAGAYGAESDYFETAWQQSFWGANYPKLQAIKRKYDPDGLFFVHHGVGSEEWSLDGFHRLV